MTYAPLSQYEIVVLTGDRYGAGTNSNVTMQLYGEKGDTGRLPLNNSYHFYLSKKFRKLIFFFLFISVDNFERNSRDVFKHECGDLGKLTKLSIEHDNS